MKKLKLWIGVIIIMFFLPGFLTLIPGPEMQEQTKISDKTIKPSSSEASISLEWVNIFDQNPYDSAKAVATDSFGDIYLVGDCQSVSLDYNILLVKYSKNGGLLWSKQWNRSSSDSGFDIAIDSRDDIYVVGNTFEDGISPCIIKFDKNGKELGNHTWDSMFECRSYGVAIDSKDNVYMTGNGLSQIDGYGNPQWNSFLIKYNSSGYLEWELTIPQSLSSDIAVDTEDNVYIVGSFHGSTHDILLKFSGEGDSLQNVTWDRAEHISANSIAIDMHNNVYITGTNVTISNGNMKGAMMVVKYNPEGIFQWMSIWDNGFNEENSSFDVCVDSMGNIYLSGRTSNSTNYDSILLQYNRTGHLMYTSQWDNKYVDSSFGIAIDNSSNDLYITGESNDFGPNTDAFLLKYNNSLGPQDSIQGDVGNNGSTKNNSDSQNNNKSKTSINGYNLAVILVSIGIVSFHFKKMRKKYKTHN